MVEELPVGYYLDNFSYVLEFVSSQYADLLGDDERAYASTFSSLSEDARKLYVRLSGRKGPLFRSDKLSYPEIGAIDRAAAELCANGFLDNADDVSAAELLGLLTRPELVALKPGFSPGAGAVKADVIDQLQVLPTEVIRGRIDFCVLRPLQLEVLRCYRLLFFGNLHQDFTEFVLHDLGISPYEQYSIDPNDRFFDDRAVLEETLHLYDVGEMAQAALETEDPDLLAEFGAAIPSPRHDALERRAGRIRNRIARQLERYERLDEALCLYQQSSTAPARERAARILEKTGAPDAALAICEQILADPEDESEFEFAESFGARIARKHAIDVPRFRVRPRDDFPTRQIEIEQMPGTSVEELVRCWFEVRGDQAVYVENGLLPSLFGLAFWDIIFRPTKGAFFNPFQRGPADLFTADFREARAESIEARFAAISDPAFFRRLVIQHRDEKAPRANHFVHWGLVSDELLALVFERIPVTDLVQVFRRLLRDLRNNRAGFPDLVVFPTAGSYLLAEVKGPGDTLQANQKRWLRYFSDKGIPAEVVYVSWTP